MGLNSGLVLGACWEYTEMGRNSGLGIVAICPEGRVAGILYDALAAVLFGMQMCLAYSVMLLTM